MIITNGVVIRGGGTTLSADLPSGSADFTIPGYYIWRPPVEVSYVDITTIGAGGGGMDYISHPTYRGGFAGGGGGGLGFASNYPVNSNQVYYINVGQGGAAGYYNFPGGPGSTGDTGGDTWVKTPDNNNLVYIYGAGGGRFPPFVPGGSNNAGGGPAPGVSNWAGYVYSGGTGQPGSTSPLDGRQGGGAARHTGNGVPGATYQNSPGAGSPLYGPSVGPASPSTARALYGGGGGGAGTNPGQRNGFAGNPGAVRISWGSLNSVLYPRP